MRGTEGLEELHRPWIDDVVIRCGECARGRVAGCPTSATAGSTPGIVPFSTLGWHNETFVEAGYAEGAGVGVTIADLPDHAHWEKWYPADWVSEMREQIRLWFYSMLFMGVALDGRVALPAGAHLREGERRDRAAHAQVVGERDLVRGRDRGDGRRRHALDVRRPAAGPEPELRLRPGRRRQEAAADAVEHVRVLRHSTPASTTSSPTLRRSPPGPARRPTQPLDRWVVARTQALVASAARRSTARLAAARAGVRDVPGRPVELVRAPSRSRFWQLRRRRRHPGSLRDALVRARAGHALRLAGDAVPDRRDVAEPRARRLPGRAPGRAPGRYPEVRDELADAGLVAAMESRPRRRRARPPQPRRGQRSSCASRCAEVIVATDHADRRRQIGRARRPDRRRARGEGRAPGDLGRGVRPDRGRAAAQGAGAQVRPRPGR